MVNLTFSKNDGTTPKLISLFNRAVTIMISIVLSLGLTIIADVVCLLLNEQGKNFHDIYSNMKVVSTEYVY